MQLPNEIVWNLNDLDIADLDLTNKADLREFESYLAECISNMTGYFINYFDYKLSDKDVTIYDIEYVMDEEQ